METELKGGMQHPKMDLSNDKEASQSPDSEDTGFVSDSTLQDSPILVSEEKIPCTIDQSTSEIKQTSDKDEHQIQSNSDLPEVDANGSKDINDKTTETNEDQKTDGKEDKDDECIDVLGNGLLKKKVRNCYTFSFIFIYSPT